MNTVETPSEAQAFTDICGIVCRVLELEPGDLEITRDMSLTDDLGLESIDLVAIGAMLTERYDERVNLAAYLADLDMDDVIALRVGDLTGFVTSRLSDGRIAEH